MSHFVQGFGNKTIGFPLINLDLVQELRPDKDPNGKTVSYRCYNVNDELVGRISTYNVPEKTHVIPNTQPAIRFLSIWLEDDGSLCKTEYPIIGWVLDGTYFHEPLITESLDDFPFWCLTDENAWWVPNECHFTNEKYFNEYVARTLKKDDSPHKIADK